MLDYPKEKITGTELAATPSNLCGIFFRQLSSETKFVIVMVRIFWMLHRIVTVATQFFYHEYSQL